jgi:hypothetical protein
MPAPSAVSVTPAQIKEWKATAAEHERLAKLFLAKAAAGETILAGDAAPAESDDGENTNLMGTLRTLANESPKPIPKADLKKMLIHAGIPADRVNGTYFYLAIRKLKDKGRVSVKADGSIWKGDTDVGKIMRR